MKAILSVLVGLIPFGFVSATNAVAVTSAPQATKTGVAAPTQSISFDQVCAGLNATRDLVFCSFGL